MSNIIVVFNKGLKILKAKILPDPPGIIYTNCSSKPPSHTSFLPFNEFLLYILLKLKLSVLSWTSLDWGKSLWYPKIPDINVQSKHTYKRIRGWDILPNDHFYKVKHSYNEVPETGNFTSL